jgi:hypothetical protein
MKNKIFFLKIAPLIFFISFTIFFLINAAPPLTPYLPGETLNPNCAPGDPNCTVYPPAISTRQIQTTSPLTGGGDLSQDRTLSLIGLSSLGSAHQLLGVKSDATGLEYKNIASLLTAGSGISISGTATATISNTGVLSLNSLTGNINLQGTTNQINVATSSGTITLSLPQDIALTSSPTFANLTISGTGTTTHFNVSGLTNLATTTISTQLAVPKIVTLTGNLTIDPSGNLIISKSTSISGDLTISGTATTTQLSVTSTSTLGTVISGTWQGTAIGTQYGGTGQNWSAIAQGNIPYFSATGVMATLAPGTANQVLITGGAGANPSWSNIASLLTAGSGISISGTTNATITNTGVLSLNSASGALTLQGTTNQVNVSTVGSTITLSTPQDIATSSSPTFAGLTLSNLTSGSVLFAGGGGVISQDNANLFWDNTNKRLGIGTTTPAYKLDVSGDLRVSGQTIFGGVAYTWPSSAGSSGQVLTTDGAGILSWSTITTGVSGSGTQNYLPKWTATTTLGNSIITDDGSLVTISGQLQTTGTTTLATSQGNVGIGTTGPADKLHLIGQLRLDNDTDPTNKGCFRYNGTLNQLEYSNDCVTFQGFSASTGGGWTDTGTVVTLTTGTDDVCFGSNCATIGKIRLPNNQYIYSRNAGNTADLRLLGLNSSNQLALGDSGISNFQLPGVSSLTLDMNYAGGPNTLYFRNSNATYALNVDIEGNLTIGGGTIIGITDLSISGFFSAGSTPATTGIIRIPNNQYIYSRNAGNTADLRLLGLNSSNQLVLGDSGISNFQLPGVSSLTLDMNYAGGPNTLYFRNSNATYALNVDIEGGLKANLVSGAVTTDVNIDASNNLIRVSSSQRFKDNIRDLEIDTSKIYSLKPRTFEWNENTITPGQTDFGLIAEEVSQIIPQLVSYDLEGKPYSVKYQMLSVLILNELKKQKGEIEELKLAINNQDSLTQDGQEFINSPPVNSLAGKIKQLLEKLGLFIENGIAKLKEIIVEKLTAEIIVTKEIKTEKITTNEIQLVDKATGETYCVRIENGEWVKVKGECESLTSQPPTNNTQPTPTPTEEVTPSPTPSPFQTPEPTPTPSPSPSSTPDLTL